MSDETGLSLDEIINMQTWNNLSAKVYVGKVKERNDFTLNFLSGTWTSFDYKMPFVYDNVPYRTVSVVSVMMDENNARTGVWAIPVRLHAGEERELEEFRQMYKPFKLPEIHEKVVGEIEGLHRKMHADRIHSEILAQEEFEKQFSEGGRKLPF